MRFELFIARRYLTKGRKNSFISTISLASIIGFAIGVAALIVALSLINGFQNDIRNKILSSSAHVMVAEHFGTGMANHQEVIRLIEQEIKDVKRLTPVVFNTVLVKGNSPSVSGAVFRGMSWGNGGNEPWLNTLEMGQLPAAADEILIGREMAIKLGLFPGDLCTVVTPQPSLSPTGLMAKFRKFRISGVFKSGLYEFDSGTIVAPLKTAQKLFGLGDKISYIQVNLNDLFKAEAVGKKLQEVLPPSFSVITWKELNESLYSALKLEKTVLFFTLTLIIVVASLNIVAGLILLVIQKIRDIGILLSYGVTSKTIRKIFFIQGGVIGILGTAAGVFLGLGFCYLANRFQLIKVPAEIYQVSHVPFRIDLLDLVEVVVAAILIGLLATLIPSKRAAAVNVVEAVKYE